MKLFNIGKDDYITKLVRQLGENQRYITRRMETLVAEIKNALDELHKTLDEVAALLVSIRDLQQDRDSVAEQNDQTP